MQYTWLKRDPYWEEENSDPRIDPSDMHLKDCDEDEAEFFRTNSFVEGDYCGYGVQGRANQQALRNEFEELEGLVYWQEHWPYSTTDIVFSIQVLKDPTYQELKETLEGLENYPIIDEEALSELETEEEWEAWTNYGCDDFRRELNKLASHHEELFDRIYNHADGSNILMEVWREVANEPVIHESGGAYFPFDHYLGREYCITHDDCRQCKELAHACVREQRQETWHDIRSAIITVLHQCRAQKKRRSMCRSKSQTMLDAITSVLAIIFLILPMSFISSTIELLFH